MKGSLSWSTRVVLLLLVATLGSGCAFWRTRVRYYEPPAVSAFTPVDQRWEVLKAMARDHNWSIEIADEAGGRLVAFNEPADGLREKIAITLRPHDSIVSITSELLIDGQWSHTVPYACATYGYHREKTIAETLDGRSSDLPQDLPAATVHLSSAGTISLD